MRSGLTRLRARLRAARRRGEEGFSLIEAIVATSLAAVLLLTMSYATASGLNAVVSTKLTQQATHLGSQALEKARELPYRAVTSITSELTGDSAFTSACPGLTGATRYFDPDGTGPLLCEKVVEAGAPSPEGAMSPHVESITVESAVYSVATYVTYVDRNPQGGPDNDYKRVVAVVTWEDRARTRTFRASTLVTRAQRGLGTTDFELTPDDQTSEANPGDRVVFGHALVNHGVDDSYEIEVTIPTGRSWTVRIFRDADFDGNYDPAVDVTEFVDSDGDGGINTPEITTGQTVYFLVTWQLSATEVLADDLVTEITVTSASSGTATEVSVDSLDVVDFGTRLYLHNNPSPPVQDTVAQSTLQMDTVVPSATTLFAYSTNQISEPGRFIAASNAGPNATQTDRVAAWTYFAPTAITLSGTATLDFHVVRPTTADCTNPLRFKVFLREKATVTASNGTEFATGTIVSSACGTPSLVQMSFPSLSRTIAANRAIEVKIVLESGTGLGSAAMLYYDTASYRSVLELPTT